MNSLPMVLRLCFGIGDAVERAEEQSPRRRRAPAGCCSGRGTASTTCLAFVEPQQAVIDEHAGELVADRLVDQHRRDREVDAARQPADHPALADLRRGSSRSPRP